MHFTPFLKRSPRKVDGCPLLLTMKRIKSWRTLRRTGGVRRKIKQEYQHFVDSIHKDTDTTDSCDCDIRQDHGDSYPVFMKNKHYFSQNRRLPRFRLVTPDRFGPNEETLSWLEGW